MDFLLVIGLIGIIICYSYAIMYQRKCDELRFENKWLKRKIDVFNAENGVDILEGIIFRNSTLNERDNDRCR